MAAAPGLSGINLIDTRVIGKPAQFHGKESHFIEWRENFSSWAELLNPACGGLLEAASKEKNAIAYEPLTQDMKIMTHMLFHVLMQVCKGRAFTVVRRIKVMTGFRNGFEAWRRLFERFYIRTDGRCLADLHILMTPHWKTEGEAFEDDLED